MTVTSVCLDDEELAMLDKLRGGAPRSRYLKALLAADDGPGAWTGDPPPPSAGVNKVSCRLTDALELQVQRRANGRPIREYVRGLLRAARSPAPQAVASPVPADLSGQPFPRRVAIMLSRGSYTSLPLSWKNLAVEIHPPAGQEECDRLLQEIQRWGGPRIEMVGSLAGVQMQPVYANEARRILLGITRTGGALTPTCQDWSLRPEDLVTAQLSKLGEQRERLHVRLRYLDDGIVDIVLMLDISG